MMEDRKERGRLVESLPAKITAFFILAIGFMLGALGAWLTVYLAQNGYYVEGYERMVHDRMVSEVWGDVHHMNELFQDQETARDNIELYLSDKNLAAELYDRSGLHWTFAAQEVKDSPYHFVCYTTAYMDQGEKVRELTYYLYVDPDFPMQDTYWKIERECRILAEYAAVFPAAAVIGLLSAMIAFIFLLSSAGHHRGKEGISGSVLSRLPFDFVTLFFAATEYVLLIMTVEIIFHLYNWIEALTGLLLLTLMLVWGTVYLREFALHMKMGDVFRHTITYRLCRKVIRGIAALIRGLPLVAGVCAAYAGISFLEFMGLAFCGCGSVAFSLWLLEKIVLLFVVLYVALMCKRLQQGSERLAAGNLTEHVNTVNMILAFKQHGENLNSIAQGMSVAVEQRVKSERLKTELITNVSHDIKTPLTSIINYADLIGSLISGDADAEKGAILQSGGVVSEVSDAEEHMITGGEREKLSEYAEVLLRQSRRLKKLLDDLLEASKATTGNLEVYLQPCEVGVLLTQAVGEYEQRFQQKELELITEQPESAITVMADGRHIWRVFDNLLNNICKYAQEHSRVYLTVELRTPKQVEIIFRNMSKYPLHVKGAELKERFVRGDQSRHMEGNGLGLSIAASLVELQGGEMEIITDGDLFKVIVRLPVTEGAVVTETENVRAEAKKGDVSQNE